MTKNTIRFEDPSAAREYAALRERILPTVEAAQAAGGAEQPGPMSYLLQAIGATRLPAGDLTGLGPLDRLVAQQRPRPLDHRPLGQRPARRGRAAPRTPRAATPRPAAARGGRCR